MCISKRKVNSIILPKGGVYTYGEKEKSREEESCQEEGS